MRNLKNHLFLATACIAVFAFLCGGASLMAAEKDNGLFGEKPGECRGMAVGPYKGEPSLFLAPSESSCTSGCCYAWASCSGGGASTSCSETGCSASCPDGTSSSYTCSANAQ